MKCLKFSLALVISASLLMSVTSCKKDKEPAYVQKEQLLGKWDMTVQTSGSLSQLHATLKGSGAMELDMSPYDGTPDIIMLWSTAKNSFNAHLDIDSVPNAYEVIGSIDPLTLGIAGQFKINDPQSPVSYIFTMDKQ